MPDEAVGNGIATSRILQTVAIAFVIGAIVGGIAQFVMLTAVGQQLPVVTFTLSDLIALFVFAGVTGYFGASDLLEAIEVIARG